jgi:gamma-glutamyl-gamma-aminobutyrate hydrolase PuuD
MVGITTYVVVASFGVWEEDSALVPHEYVLAVERAGGRPLLVPPTTEGVEETLDALDGLIVSGGSDLDPALYGEDAHPQTDRPFRLRDTAELALMRAALDRDLPVLGICRGSQVLNIALGGDLVQHLPDVVGNDRHREIPGTFAEHEVAIEPGSKLAETLGANARVKSHHHQGLGQAGRGLSVTARAEDGTAEGLEARARRFAVGVLWHPEAGEDQRLFEALVAEAARYRAAKG